ncbi:class I SAM-dependent methyltransferase [Nocardioides pacificus]
MDTSDWDERYTARELVWSAEPNEFVARECADLSPGSAVDVAAGEGRNAIWLATRGWDVTALDFSAVALDKGRRLAGEVPVARPVEWVRADATTWEPDRTYDLAVLAYLQLPATERRAAVRNAFEALAPGGTLLVVAHDTTNLTEGTGGPQDERVLMTAEDVLGDLEGLDLEVVRAERVERVVTDASGTHEHPSGGRTAYDCLVRVVRR